ncbi:hypothetical protein AX17_007317 [Amanita inopinata Kibby_2008]|nr:hypothetical protein AX17_007317 [Amanita inopinata Kibby_2008]
MTDLTRLSRPELHQIKIDPTPRDCLSDGFSYPTFHLLNKQARVLLSEPLKSDPLLPYRLLSIANHKGWFAAVRIESYGTSIILSPLHELRSSLKAAKENEDSLFIPRRTIKLPAEDVNIIAFGLHDTRLLVAFGRGQLMVYDTAHLFSPGLDNVEPLNASAGSSAPFLQILPNPGIEADLAHLIAVVRGDGIVQVMDINTLEPQGGWAGEGEATPVAISWAPKGRHLAIGLRAGDIFTYAMSGKTVPQKQIPPTADGYLISVEWIGPGYVFKTTYCSRIPESTDATLHVVHVDTKSSKGTYFNLMHPFPAADRTKQHAMTLVIPKWDETPETPAESSTGLAVVGDMSSVDLEVLAHTGTQWFQQSQENPLQLPLNNSMNDTTLMSLEVDLTDSDAGVPIMYAYLNDGTLQGWHLDHPRPYVGMVKSELVSTPRAPPLTPPSFPSTLSQPVTTSPFNQARATGQSAFSQPPSTSPFAQQQPVTSPFGQPPSAVFGQPSLSASAQPPSSAFGNVVKSSGVFRVSGFGSAPSTGGAATAFSGLGASSRSNVFGQPSFGFSSSTTTPQTPTSPTITREASMADETPSVGGLSLGSEAGSQPKSGGGIFGSFLPPTSNAVPFSAFGGTIKPATGFGAFNNYPSSQSTTNGNSDASKPALAATSASASTASAAPGQPTFGQTAFSKPTFGQPSFGQPSLAGASSSTSGGFGAFATNGPTPFDASTKTAGTSVSGGFGAFASSSPTAFGTTFQSTAIASESERSKSSPFATASNGSGSAFNGGFGAVQKSPFAQDTSFTSQNDSKKGISSNAPVKTNLLRDSPPSSPEAMAGVKSSLPIDDDMSPPSSPIKQNAISLSTTPAQPPPASAFSNLTTAAIKPASGFGAFGASSTPTSSPFFKKPETPTTPVTILGKPSSSTTPTVPPPDNSAPKFGSTSMPGTIKSAFVPASSPITPVKVPSTGGFGAFSGTASGFAAFAGSGKSFNELLKSKDEVSGSPTSEKDKGNSLSSTPSKKAHVAIAANADKSISGQKSESAALPSQESVLVTPKKEEVPVSLGMTRTPVFTPPPKPATTTPTSELPDKGIAKSQETKESPPEKKPLSSEESFVEVTGEEGEISEEESRGSNEEEKDGYLSGSFGVSDSESSVDGTEEEEEEEEERPQDSEGTEKPTRSPSIDPSAIPLPLSRSPSVPPLFDTPSTQITLPLSTQDSTQKRPSPPIREPSTTPPGLLPAKTLAFAKSSSTAPSAGSPISLGLGRPSTRPARSSPLAGAPVSRADQDETGEKVEKSKLEPSTDPATLAEPVSAVVIPNIESAEDEEELTKTPKTPPLLSSASAMPQTSTTAPVSSIFGKTNTFPSLTKKAESTSPNFFGGGQGEQLGTGFFRALPVTQGGFPGNFPAAESVTTAAGGPSKLPFAIKPNVGMPSSTSPFEVLPKSGPPATPSAFPLVGRPASAPPSSFFTPPQTLPSSTSTPGRFMPGSFGIKGGSLLPLNNVPTAIPLADMQGKQLVLPYSFTKPGPTSAPSTPIPSEAPLEEGMQKECALLYNSMNQELDELRLLALEASRKRQELGKSRGALHRKADLRDASKWGVADAAQFGQVMKQYSQDLSSLKEQRDQLREKVRQIESKMLKAGTRKEEIARFTKAQNDKEFAKMLKTRTLGPEHLETQTQLRRGFRATRDRIQKLEAHLQASKKGLAEANSGRPRFRAPTLDTIHRTYRNIDLAVQHQSDEVTNLTSRVAKLKVTAPAKTPPSARIMDSESRRPFNVTPHIAITTAAALNAERSAQRLKKALLAVRKEPLLNDKAAQMVSTRTAFKTPQKIAPAPETKAPADFAFKTPISGPLFSTEAAPQMPLPDWAFPEDDFNPSPSPPSRRGAGRTKKHASPAAPLKKSTGTLQASPTPVFDWGPLPAFNQAPLASMGTPINLAPNPPGFVPLSQFKK